MIDRLWKAANKLRGQLDAAAYKHVVCALLFLRYAAEGPLRVPEEARWDRVRRDGLDAALRALERDNPALRGALPRGLEGVARLDELVDLFADLSFDASRDALGDAYEYCLRRFARAEGRRGGQFYTPRNVVRLLHALVGPADGRTRVYDPCCGAGGMFLPRTGVAFGQESNPSTWRLARMNLALHGVSVDLGPRAADSFLEDLHPGREADVVLANPPFNQSEWGAERLAGDPRWRYGPPPPGNANFAWVQHILAHLAPGGRAAVVLANGSLSATKAGAGAVRRALVEEGWVDAVVALPRQLFFATPIPASVWILSRARPDTTLFIDARGCGEQIERTVRGLTGSDIARIADACRARSDVPGFARLVDRADIARRGHVLAPGRYVEAPPVPREERRLSELRREWSVLAAESERLLAEIRDLDLG